MQGDTYKIAGPPQNIGDLSSHFDNLICKHGGWPTVSSASRCNPFVRATNSWYHRNHLTDALLMALC